VAGKPDRKGARLEVRVTEAELKSWRGLARVFERSVGEAVRVAMNAAAAPYRVGRHADVPVKAARRERREGRRGRIPSK
jgi:hypothetical protein